MTAAARKRLARSLVDEIDRERRREIAEQAAAQIDGGLGLMAVAAIAALPKGPARAVEAARWARRAAATVDQVVHVLDGATTDDELDAHVELEVALQRENARAA